MKKTVLFIAAIAVGLLTTTEAKAQDFKASEGHHNIEVNFAPLGGAPISIGQLKYRQFIADDMAVRVGFSATFSSDKGDPYEVVSNKTVNDKSSTFGLSISPGIEMHFAGTDRLSPYIGGELNFSTISNKDTDHRPNGSDYFEQVTTKGNTSFGLNALIGADWYFTQHMYMGTEIGFGFAYNKDKTSKTTNATGPGTDTSETEHGSEFKLGPNFHSGIRLGFLF